MTPQVRLGVIGLGMMGRHHARIAGSLDGVALVGGVDPAGDVHQSVSGAKLFDNIEQMVDDGIDAAVVAVPPEMHEAAALVLAGANIHALVEKPLAHTLSSAIAIRDAYAGSNLVAAVGHVERCNPAMTELKRRLDDGDLGSIISISTRRVGPHPYRVRDVGVVKDLATHDIDLVLWLGGRFTSLDAQIAHRLANPREDLLEVVGRLESGAVVSMSANWLTPMKQRSVTVLGERGALVADLLSEDLTFFANGEVPTEWEAMAQLRGVSEGDVIRLALPKQEPLRVQLERFRDAIGGATDTGIVTPDEGVDVVRVSERVLQSARS